MSNKRKRVSSRGPLTAKQWDRLIDTVVDTAREHIVVAKFLDIYGPIGAGAQSVSNPVYLEPEPGNISLHGEKISVAKPDEKETLTIPILYKDFVLYWRDIEQARETGNPLDYSAAVSATADVALLEDELIFNGHPPLNIPGLMNVDGREVQPCGNWSEAGRGFQDIVHARNRLLKNGHNGPFALALSPDAYAQLHQVQPGSNLLEIEHIRDLFTEGIYQSSQIKNGLGVLVATGGQNVDLAIAQDVDVAFLNDDNMNYYYRVYECLVPRIKRPTAVCTLVKA
ncbi:family 1 encapsulin nanocompartment shell protein [Paenibacillus turpanensis]|uniref:family 1 encapsulin nanocompartment shell protein n=1 Tax=Paenibacillus turpanensis TaxID=2689078 RepID=UPI00140A68D7|nr:family 1 encapsulin nanocompartment shell protein [Paenibacillus turpanensis]